MKKYHLIILRTYQNAESELMIDGQLVDTDASEIISGSFFVNDLLNVQKTVVNALGNGSAIEEEVIAHEHENAVEQPEPGETDHAEISEVTTEAVQVEQSENEMIDHGADTDTDTDTDTEVTEVVTSPRKQRVSDILDEHQKIGERNQHTKLVETPVVSESPDPEPQEQTTTGTQEETQTELQQPETNVVEPAAKIFDNTALNTATEVDLSEDSVDAIASSMDMSLNNREEQMRQFAEVTD
ncbi:hypothetical protein [Weissella viridescens]|uniref:hypothetical protein n=1 Tax=Weissella viridescens TaxID=1629 RepID=UPI003AF30BFF